MLLTKSAFSLAAGVAAGLFLAMASSSPTAAADPTTPTNPETPTNSGTPNVENSAAAQELAGTQESAKLPLDISEILQSSASALNSIPVVFPTTPVAVLQSTAAMLAAAGLSG